MGILQVLRCCISRHFINTIFTKMLQFIQIEQLVNDVVASDADFVIVGGDLNAQPNHDTGMNTVYYV